LGSVWKAKGERAGVRASEKERAKRKGTESTAQKRSKMGLTGV